MKEEKKHRELEEINYWIEHKKRNSAVSKIASSEQQKSNVLLQTLKNQLYNKMT